jgi:hypothetical protein
MKGAHVIALCLALASSASATEGWTSFGNSASDSCGKFLAARRPDYGLRTKIDGTEFVDQSTVYREWIEGFISGVNLIHARFRSVQSMPKDINADSVSTELWIANYCQTHPAERLVDAAVAFVVAHSQSSP